MNEDGYHFLVYKTTNLVNGKFYIGFHKTLDIDDGYLGSGKLIRRAIEKYGPSNFARIILQDFDTKEAAEAYEASLVNTEFVLETENYNLALGGNVRIMPGASNPFFGKTHTEETRKKISEAKLGVTMESRRSRYIIHGKLVLGAETACSILELTTNRRENLLVMCGDPSIPAVFYEDALVQEAAQKYFNRKLERLATKSLVLSEGARARFSGKKKTPEHRQNISKGLRGIPRLNPQNSDPVKIARTVAKTRGTKRSPESRLKMSEAAKSRTQISKI
jgi:hypothetical protein